MRIIGLGLATGALLLGALPSDAVPSSPGNGVADVRQLIVDRDGAPRQLFGVASPESWLEDFGRGDLVAGSATIALDPDFAAAVVTDVYHVFLTPLGDSGGLYATNLGPTGFAVREQQGGKSSIGFSYRVVARRKEAAGSRFPRAADAVPADVRSKQAAPAEAVIPPAPTLVPLPKLEPPPPIPDALHPGGAR
ncbi:MAG: hypothetical protein U0821_19235 [Chloroflexota bacterium]